jgi:hypothetical protein
MGLWTGRVRPWTVAIALLLGAVPPVAGQGSVSIDRFTGTWDLVDWRTTSAAGEVRFPYGEGAQGQLIYTVDGRMSAHLMNPPADPSEAPLQHLAYWGTVTLDVQAGTVTHHVLGSNQANWIGSAQVRAFSFQGDDRLVLSLGSNRLTWVRVRSPR